MDPQLENPQSLTGTSLHAEGGKEGSNRRRKQWQAQARGAGHRVEQHSLVGCGWVRRPGGQHFVKGEEVESGCKIEVIRW